MNLDDLEAFSAFAECLNFTHAAEKLSISQPALHAKIRNLGKNLGAGLYVKEGRSLRLTLSGEKLARYARETLASHQRFLEKLHGKARASQVTLAAGAGSFLYLLGPAIQRFKERYDGELKLVTASRPRALNLLDLGAADIVVTVLKEIPAPYRGRLLCRLPTRLIVSKLHPLGRRRKLSTSELEGVPLILPPRDRPFRDALEACFSLRKVTLTVCLEAEGWDLMMHFANLGLGATLVNGCCRVPEGCASIPVDDLLNSEYYLLYPRDVELSPPAQELVREICRDSDG